MRSRYDSSDETSDSDSDGNSRKRRKRHLRNGGSKRGRVGMDDSRNRLLNYRA